MKVETYTGPMAHMQRATERTQTDEPWGMRSDGFRSSCSSGWFALPNRGGACKKCGARQGEACKAERPNQ